MSKKDQRRLRLVSPEPTKSDGNSSVQVNEASSHRAQSTTPQPRTQSPEPSSSASTRPLAHAQTPSLRNQSSIEDDLRGLGSRADPHGIKRSRADLSDDEDPDDEPTPKRDRLLEELCNLQSTDHGANLASLEDTDYEEAIPVQAHQTRPPENHVLPLRGHRKVGHTTSIEERNPPWDPKFTPDSPFSGSETREDAQSPSRRQFTPPARP
ncbi:hypothetical protein CONLIGDRAFT_241136 [Coniochaeta ligniaria NRRL 30616]|uniref:Uncharacterized protein n=1 Tax=Coniochaeta ligniaria NRRL 30616 TaxID=1408157 RepID=A0A1J7JR06_9PEZI|nr:hypothetical protein CONLIGDRAFT_241136 [Coniochaeta ligniaria NRRL 30616]